MGRFHRRASLWPEGEKCEEIQLSNRKNRGVGKGEKRRRVKS